MAIYTIFKNHKCQPVVGTRKMSVDQQSNQDSSFKYHDYLYEVSWQCNEICQSETKWQTGGFAIHRDTALKVLSHSVEMNDKQKQQHPALEILKQKDSGRTHCKVSIASHPGRINKSKGNPSSHNIAATLTFRLMYFLSSGLGGK